MRSNFRCRASWECCAFFQPLMGNGNDDHAEGGDAAPQLPTLMGRELRRRPLSPAPRRSTAWRTLQLPDIAALRTRLIPEWPIYKLLADGPAPPIARDRDGAADDGIQ